MTSSPEATKELQVDVSPSSQENRIETLSPSISTDKIDLPKFYSVVGSSMPKPIEPEKD